MKYYNWPIMLVLASIFYATDIYAQEKVSLSGYVKDAANGETLIGVTIYFDELSTGTTTNVYGFYSISVPPGSYTTRFSYVGYDITEKKIELNESTKLDIELAESISQLEEVVVTGEVPDANVTSTEMSVAKLDAKTIEKMPALLGEVDVIRSIQLLPGVSTVGEGATGFNVRGGDISQNLVLLDEAPVYNTSHLFGFFSVFNPDAVKDVKLIKGGIPAQYGGRISSLLDVRMKEGNKKRLAVSGGIGAVFSRLTVEGPIKKDKSSFIVSGRRSYIDVLAAPFLSDDLSGSQFYFYDLTMKTNFTLNEKNRIFFSGYLGRDRFSFGEDARFSWGNSTATFRWNRTISDRLFSNLTVYFSDYDYSLGFGSDNDTFDWDSKIRNYSIKPELSYYLNPNNLITFGGQVILYDFSPAEAIARTNGNITDISLENKLALSSAVYIGNEQTLNDRVSMQYGLRLSHWNYIGPGSRYDYLPAPPGERRPLEGTVPFANGETIQQYMNLEPRFSIKYQLDKESSIKASYNRTAQYIHLISNGTASNPLDVWVPSTNNVAPQVADQIAGGYFRNFNGNDWEFSAELYYKRIDNEVDYVDGADLLVNEFLEGELLSGRGRAYGLELYLRKNNSRLNGWLSYTLGRSERLVDGINNAEWYPNRFDQLHNLSMVGFYDLNERWQFSANFLVASGTPATFYTNRVEWQGYVYGQNPENRRNNFRLDPYHRLDLSATLQNKKNPDKRWESYWVFSIYNLYGRRNPFSIFFQQQGNRPAGGQPIQTQALQFAVLGTVVPSVSYNFKF